MIRWRIVGLIVLALAGVAVAVAYVALFLRVAFAPI